MEEKCQAVVLVRVVQVVQVVSARGELRARYSKLGAGRLGNWD
jgi:hypothetical protein